jgi:lipoprotein-anchoring transpeptidase ErfK/SrfK
VPISRIAVISAAGLTAFLVAGCTGSAVSTRAGVEARKAVTPTGPPRLVSVSPAPGSADVNGASQITVTYSRPLTAAAELPRLSPAIAGTWQRSGDKAIFTPEAGFAPRTHVTVTIPGVSASTGTPGSTTAQTSVNGTTGNGTSRNGTAGSGIATTTVTATSTTASVTFTTGSLSTLRLQQLLAQLGYLPLTWTPAAASAEQANGDSPRQELSAAYDPPAGTFSWAGGYPSQLQSFWSQGQPNTLTRGAVTGFEGDHGMTTDGNASTAVWTALLKAAAAGQDNTHGYSYAIVSQHNPESITIWHDGRKAFESVVNTGISVSPTPIGTFPVYEKLPYQIMSGTNPDGSHYADPVQWVSYFEGGSAVHYFSRYTYGWPQSLGCVELPYSSAKQAYPLLPYGTLVTVTSE